MTRWVPEAEPLLEGRPDYPVTQGLGGPEVVSQHAVIPLGQLRSFDM